MGSNINDDCIYVVSHVKYLLKKLPYLEKYVSFKEKPFSLHNLYNFMLTLHIPIERKSCKGVGKTPFQHCDCLHNLHSHANASKQNDTIFSNKYQYKSFIQKNKEEIKEYLNKLMVQQKKTKKFIKKLIFKNLIVAMKVAKMHS